MLKLVGCTYAVELGEMVFSFSILVLLILPFPNLVYSLPFLGLW